MNQSKYIRIVQASSAIARERGLLEVTRDAIAKEAEVAPGLVSHYFGTMGTLRDTLMQLAISSRDAVLLSRGLAIEHPGAMAAPPALKKQAIQELTDRLSAGM